MSPFRGRGKCEDRNYKEIVERDLRDIDRAEIVLAEMTQEDHPYIGTSMEIMYAAEVRKIPIVVWTTHLKDHFWIKKYACRTYSTVEEACKYIKEFWGTKEGIR